MDFRSYERSVFKNNTLGFTRLGGDEDSNWKGSYLPKLIFLVPHQQREIRYINAPQIVGVSHDKEGRRGGAGAGGSQQER